MASSAVADFFRDKNVFVTGGTGFLGVCLIEKLLRCCSGVKNIYILIRPKKGKDIQERLVELMKNSVFDRIKKENNEDLFKKLIAVAGDVGEDNLGLSSNDRLTLVEHINIVVHSAATLDFEADLKSTVNINLLGTRRVVQISQEIRDLKALVHVSSAYVNSVLRECHEKLYPPPVDVEELLKLVEESDDATLKAETAKIIKDHPNPYTFTKHLAEHEVANSNLPATIVRPSMITGAWKEPVPGWTVSKNGPQGFLMGASKGVVRRLPVAKDLIYDYIPVDLVVNSILVCAYNISQDSKKELKIYHCTSSTSNPFRWQRVSERVDEFLHKYPLCSAVWYPSLKLLPSLFWFRISAIFVHMIPAYVLDTVTQICGGRPILVRLHTNVNKSLVLLEKFIFTEWKFYNPSTLELHDSLSAEDKRLFTLDVRGLNWEEYFVDLTQGVRQYLSKESPKSLTKARTKDKILMVAHLALQAALLGIVWWITKTILSSTWTQTGLIVPIVYVLFNLL
ncbi:putative fatty acyl-CoA reductase CG8306 [Belonocnema kinseyi]|uniref:putative fatty acyl-CoA reductase CG8306 n=1 Tax=Belonocnema kinseyi TaxID=2817044 RepID=UPI00143CE560|nr:putative fatty acyl-CoA reductase CG8306 [Belonocnema kinseyi]